MYLKDYEDIGMIMDFLKFCCRIGKDPLDTTLCWSDNEAGCFEIAKKFTESRKQNATN